VSFFSISILEIIHRYLKIRVSFLGEKLIKKLNKNDRKIIMKKTNSSVLFLYLLVEIVQI
jgi:hypothetical protein